MATDPILAGFEERGAYPFVFDFDQFAKMEEAGVFGGDPGRVELLQGKIIKMSPASNAHAFVTADLVSLLSGALRDGGLKSDLRVGTQGTIRIDTFSAPEPDVYVVRPVKGRTYAEAADAVLVVEVSLSTRRDDLIIKGPLYAGAGIAEYWIVDPAERAIHVHRRPQPGGRWAETLVVTEGDVRPLFAPTIAIALTDVFAGL